MKYSLITILLFLILQSCQDEEITIDSNVSETFYVENEGASMRVLVEGNTSSSTILLFVHGGPGSSAYFYNTDYISENIEDKYAIAYWDQRNSGASQGNANGDYLNLPTMTVDLKKVIEVLKYRYGSGVNIFLLAHSFGGMLSTSFLTTENYQDLVKGWIVCSASHNYPLNDNLSKEALIYYANQEIDLGNHESEWQKILDFCTNLPAGILSLAKANQLNSYCADAEGYFSDINTVSLTDILKANAISQNYAVNSALLNHSYSQNADINSELRTYDFTSVLKKVTIPIMTLYGAYDFICPPALGADIINNVNSTDVTSFLLPHSGHTGMFQDEELFCEKVNEFIELHK